MPETAQTAPGIELAITEVLERRSSGETHEAADLADAAQLLLLDRPRADADGDPWRSESEKKAIRQSKLRMPSSHMAGRRT